MRSLPLLALALACGGSSSPPAQATGPNAAPPTEDATARTIEAGPGGDEVMAEDLRVLCAGLDDVRRDPTRPLRERLRELEASVRDADAARGERFDALLSRPPGPDTTGASWSAAIRERAAIAGVPMPRGACPALAPVLTEALGVPHGGVSFAEDLARLCTVVAEARSEEADASPDVQAVRVADRIDAALSHPLLREMLEAIAGVEARVRYATFVGWALEDPGVEPGWSCPPLEAQWSPG